MGLDGMEIMAIAAVVGLFIVVLKQFGIWEPLSLEGKIDIKRLHCNNIIISFTVNVLRTISM